MRRPLAADVVITAVKEEVRRSCRRSELSILGREEVRHGRSGLNKQRTFIQEIDIHVESETRSHHVTYVIEDTKVTKICL